MKHLKHLLYFIFALNLALHSPNLMAQDPEMGLTKLSKEDLAKYRQIIDDPIDQSLLNLTKIDLHIKKEVAAIMLGDQISREKNLLEWTKIDVTAKVSLRRLYSNSGRHEDAVRIGLELLKEPVPEMQFGATKARNYCYLADDYMRINDLSKANEYLLLAESEIKSMRNNNSRRSDLQAWYFRAESEYFLYKSIYLMKVGKWDESLSASKLSIERVKDTLGVINLFKDEKRIQAAKNTAAEVMRNIVNQQLQMGQLISAEWSLRDAFKLAKANGLNENHMFSFDLLSADLFNGKGQFQTSIDYIGRAQNLHINQGYVKSNRRWMRSKSLELTALSGLDQWDKAFKVLQESNEDTKGTLFEPKNTINGKLIGLIHIKNNSIDEAIEVLSKTYTKDNSIYGPKHYYTAISQGLLGVAYWKKGDLAKARSELESARTIINSPDSLSGDFSESAIQRKTNRFIFESYMQMLAQTAQNNAQDAETLFLLSDQVNSSSVQQALSEAAVRSGVNIPGLSDVIRKEQDAKNEMATLVTYIANQNSQQDTKQNPQVVEQMRKRLFELEGLRKGYKAAIQKGYPEYFQLIQPKAPSTQEIAKLLAEDEVFVSILPMAGETYVWGIDHKGQTKFHRSDWSEQKTNTTVDALRKTLDVAGLGKRMPKFDYQGAHAIYKAFFEPLGELTQGKKHMVVSTSSALAKLPFAVLQTQAFNGSNPVDAPWLVKSMAVSHVPTASGWMSLKRFGKVPHSVEAMVAWGDPLFDGKAVQKMADAAKVEKADKPSGMQVAMTEPGTTVRSVLNTRSAASLEVSDADAYLTYSKIPPLPETRDEVEELAKILGADPKNDLYLGANATRASVLKSSTSGQLLKKQVVVFATHGLLAGDLPNLSQPALAMAATANPADSPLLTLEDVLSLKLNADWVVLSACNTAGADGRAEEAMSGLARGFFFAGSRSLLVTHWSVESESAMQLTTNAFASYKKDTAMRRSEALRQSMLAVMKSPAFGHPAFWAPYALVGEGGR